MSWDKGLAMRATSGFVTDGPNDTYCIGTSDSYPTTRGGVTFGVTDAGVIGAIDSSNTVDPRIAGINYTSNPGSFALRIDLPAPGTYTFHLEEGQIGASRSQPRTDVKDNASIIYTVGPGGGAGATTIGDAVGNFTTSDGLGWPGTETGHDCIFATSTCNLVFTTTADYCCVGYVRFVQVMAAGGGASYIPQSRPFPFKPSSARSR